MLAMLIDVSTKYNPIFWMNLDLYRRDANGTGLLSAAYDTFRRIRLICISRDTWQILLEGWLLSAPCRQVSARPGER
jgi:hypothetical protein